MDVDQLSCWRNVHLRELRFDVGLFSETFVIHGRGDFLIGISSAPLILSFQSPRHALDSGNCLALWHWQLKSERKNTSCKGHGNGPAELQKADELTVT